MLRNSAAGDPLPLGTGARVELIQLGIDHIPVDQRPLRVCGLQCMVRVIQIGAADGQDAAKNDAKQDPHVNLRLSAAERAVAGAVPAELAANCGYFVSNCELWRCGAGSRSWLEMAI